MKTLIIAILLLTAMEKADAQPAAAWNLNAGLMATTTAAGIGTGGVTLGKSFLQFAMFPASGYYLALDSVMLTIRQDSKRMHGSGPLHWSLRSSLDGYTGDLMTGTLTSSDQLITVTLPAAFRTHTGAICFRVYSNDQETSSGGNNQLVFDTISVAGAASTGAIAAR